MHGCPRRGCDAQVPDSLFACRADWFRLSKPVRDAIWATNGRPLGNRERLNAIRAALEEWKPEEESK